MCNELQRKRTNGQRNLPVHSPLCVVSPSYTMNGQTDSNGPSKEGEESLSAFHPSTVLRRGDTGPEHVSSILERVIADTADKIEKHRTSGELTPVVLVDAREQTPLDIQAYPVEVCTLSAGDYGIRGFSDWNNPRFIAERKSIDDLIGSLTRERERFWRELGLLRRFGFAALLVEARESDVESGQYRSMAKPQSILASLTAIEVRMGVHVLWCGSHDGAARRFEMLVRQFVRGIEKEHKALMAALSQPLTPQNPRTPIR